MVHDPLAPPKARRRRRFKRKAQDTVPTSDAYVVYTDGSFRPPVFGAWSYLVMKQGKPFSTAHAPVRETTVNRMELTAVLKALESLPGNSRISIYSDSMYAIRCVRDWARGWKLRGWMNPLGEPIKNSDILELVLKEVDRMESVTLNHVKAHSGILHNEIVDFLAQSATYQDRLKCEIETATPAP